MKAFLGLRGSSADELLTLVDRAIALAGTDVGTLERPLTGMIISSLFFEPSTRTRLSFETAGHRLGGHTLNFFPEHSSLVKEESAQDTIMTVAAMAPDIMVIRHHTEGLPELAHRWTGLPVVNAGDGTNEHPTQALADLVTLTEQFGSVSGLDVAVVGDIAHSRVAGSLIPALRALGADPVVVGPAELVPETVASDIRDIDLDGVIGDFDVIYLLRVQKERGAVIAGDYVERFQMTGARASRMRPDAVVMHPGPINRGLEITDEVADGPRSLILRQVANGVPARMAVLEAIAGSLS